jgi:hypothetical protein
VQFSDDHTGMPNDGTRIVNGDLTETAGSTTPGVEIVAPVQNSSPSTSPKSLVVRRRDLSAHTERSGLFREIVFPRSAFRR